MDLYAELLGIMFNRDIVKISVLKYSLILQTKAKAILTTGR
jgi:hypothetical protein